MQSKSYLSRKKKCAFSDEDQILMKRFKSSVDKSKASCIASQKSQQSEHVVSDSNHDCSTTCTPQITSTVKYNDNNMNFGYSNLDIISRIAVANRLIKLMYHFQKQHKWIGFSCSFENYAEKWSMANIGKKRENCYRNRNRGANL